MPPFPKPRFTYTYDPDEQVIALRQYRDTAPGRAIPAKSQGGLLIATWNIANLGLQQRCDSDYALIAEIISWFDLVAVQEVNDDLSGIMAIHERLPSTHRLLFSDASGNRERQAFIFDGAKVDQLEEVGRLSIPPSQLDSIVLPGTTTTFSGFDRGPYLATFVCGTFRFMLVNVHLFYGSDRDPADVERRSLETFAVAWWAGKRYKDKHSYVQDIMALGDFNLPKEDPSDPIWRALTSRGFIKPHHSSLIGSAIASDSHYDQLVLFPGDTESRFTGSTGIFDFDNALFADLRATPGRTVEQVHAYLRFHISDHRPLWVHFRTR
jgi:endonuclease/exonuclease/phosphatase family metal-dependent hydrolase